MPYYSNVDFENVGKLFKTLAGLGVLSLGAGAAYAGIKGYQNRYMEATAPDSLGPSKLVRNRGKDNQILFDQEYLSDNEKEAQYIGNSMRGSFKKKAGLKDWLVGTAHDTAAAAGKGYVDGASGATKDKINEVGNWWLGTKAIPDTAINRYGDKGITFHDLDKLNDSNSTAFQRFQAGLATAPAMRSAWFLPAATAAILGGSYLGYHGIKYLNSLLGRTKPTMTYSQDAQKIYNESAQYLKDVVDGKYTKKKKKEKEASFNKQAIVSGDGSSSFWGLSALIGIPASLFVARQMRNFGSGMDSAQQELADRTHMVRAWQAAAKERNYDYNNFDVGFMDEPLTDSASKKIKSKEKKFIDDNSGDDDNNNQLRYENYVFKNIRADRDAMI